MRELATRDRLIEFMSALGREADTESRVYFTGGALAAAVVYEPVCAVALRLGIIR